MSSQSWGLGAFGFGALGLCWALAVSCAQDEREVSLVFPLLGGDSGVDGTGVGGDAAPQLDIGPKSLDLGWVATGFPSRGRLTLSNSGAAPLPQPEVSWLPGSDPELQLIQNQCLGELAPGATCELRVQLVSSRAAALQATLHVQSSVGGAFDVPVTGLALQSGDLILAPLVGSFEDFGAAPLGGRVEGEFSLSNPSTVSSGPLTFNVNRAEFSLQPPAAGDCVPGVTALVNGQSCKLRIAFTPLERGPLEATLTSASEGVGSVSLTLSGRGLSPPALEASSPTLDFDGVLLGQGAQRSVTFANAGDEPLALAGISLEPANVEGFTVQNSDCAEGTLLAGGQSCSVLVEFRPPRSSEEMTATLVATDAAGVQTQSVALRGIGLDPGLLVVAPVNEGENDFGDVLVGEKPVRVFQIQNPGAQPSGVLDPIVSESFELVAPPEAGDCVPGVTSLVNGESCTLRIAFAPLERQAVSGSLTITSPLAGAAALPLSGRGIIAAALEVDGEVNFGRVLTGLSASRTLTVRNAGDEPLPPPTLQVTGSDSTQVAAFSFQSQCALPLAFGEECTVDLTFAPTVAVAHSANLQLSATPGGTATALLLGEAQVPGSLVLAAAAGSTADFGDVAIATVATRTFTLANPGNIPSGLLTISADDNRFQPDLGDCNQDPAGLVDGASCTFSVRFAPDDSLPVAANLSVQSPGAGRAGLQVTGRGRLAATLSATGSRDLGRANLGQTVALNDFTWTVNNAGDLPTGALSVQNLSAPVNGAPEFEIRNDTCNAAAVAGRGSCQMVISFRPAATGIRSGRIVVTDPTSGSSVPLALTGLGVQVAGPGQSCVNAECGSGVCTRGVCCDRACDRTCQVCSSAGVCVDQSSREACGTGGAACFGVDNCKLTEGATCSANGGDAQCGSGNCEQRLGGAGTGDRVCCLDNCLPGQQCNAQRRCQDPALGAGASCGGAGALPCGAGLECKACRGGGNQCTPSDGCCGGCEAGLVCSGGTCQCPAGADGRAGISCGGGLCVINRANACCPNSPPAGCNCDTRDNLCKQCLNAQQCPDPGATTRATCNNNTCGSECDTPNFKACNDGTCIASSQCCGGCPNGTTCTGGICAPNLLDLGEVCAAGGTACASGNCVPAASGNRCCATACAPGSLCNAQGACEVAPTLVAPGGRCEQPNTVCAGNGICQTGSGGGTMRCCPTDCSDNNQRCSGSGGVCVTRISRNALLNKQQDCGNTAIANCVDRGGYAPPSFCQIEGLAVVPGTTNVPVCGQTGCFGPCSLDETGACVGRPGGPSERVCND